MEYSHGPKMPEEAGDSMHAAFSVKLHTSFLAILNAPLIASPVKLEKYIKCCAAFGR
jgi:hypothetical protein